MSLWKVDDVATQKLMTYFYENLVKLKDVRAAFTIAQRALRMEYPEPLYWGAFILIGN
jgi:CHAT domain-containing protein